MDLWNKLIEDYLKKINIRLTGVIKQTKYFTKYKSI